MLSINKHVLKYRNLITYVNLIFIINNEILQYKLFIKFYNLYNKHSKII